MTIPKRFNITAQDSYNYLASKEFADQQLCLILKLSGRVDENLFVKAMLLSLDQEPILGTRLVLDSGSPFWERQDDVELSKLCELVEKSSEPNGIQDFINKTIRADLDPLVTSRILRGKETDTVCIKVNHSVCDAGGLKEYVSLLSDLYGILSENPNYSAQPNLGRRDQRQIFECIRDLSKVPLTMPPRPTWAFPQKSGNSPLHSINVISSERFAAIKKIAHDNKATINDVLLTAFYRTLFEINATVYDVPMMIQVSIDLRRYCPDLKAEAICNLSGALYSGLERKQGESFKTTLERIVMLTKKLKADFPGIGSAKGLEYMFEQGYSAMKKWVTESGALGRKYNVTYPLLSNFGIIKEYRFGSSYTVNGYITSPIMYSPGFMLGLSTFNDEVTFCIGYCGQENSGMIKKFFDIFFKELPS
jgi:NRPS condensation-like uncharacterized protein